MFLHTAVLFFNMKGCYVLVIKLKKDMFIKTGRLGKIFFRKGFYVYVGSAMNNLEQRINRHLRRNKKTHWHIDYLLRHGEIKHVFYRESSKKEECNIANKLMKVLSMIPGFGCSDCSCKSHLFFGDERVIISSIRILDMKNYFF